MVVPPGFNGQALEAYFLVWTENAYPIDRLITTTFLLFLRPLWLLNSFRSKVLIANAFRSQILRSSFIPLLAKAAKSHLNLKTKSSIFKVGEQFSQVRGTLSNITKLCWTFMF